MIVLRQGPWIRRIALSVAIVILAASGAFAQDLLKEITASGLLKAVQKGENIYKVDPRAERVQFKREKDWTIFFDEANRAHARVGAADRVEEYLSESYLYLVPFYRALTDDGFRTAFLKAYPDIQAFDAETALDVSLAKAKEGIVQFNDPLAQLQIAIEWYETLSQARNMAAEKKIAQEKIDSEKALFLDYLQNVVEDLKSETTDGQAAVLANHLRALGLDYGLTEMAMFAGGREARREFDGTLHIILVDYAIGVANSKSISLGDKLDALTDGALALLDLRKLTSDSLWAEQEADFIAAANSVCDEAQNSKRSEVEQMSLDLKMILLRENVGPELWLGKKLPPTDKQEEPKPYKIALDMYREIAERALKLLEEGSLSEKDALQVELVALEAQSWVSQLIQDQGIVFSSDFTFPQAEVEKDKLLAVRLRVENNPAQTSRKAIDLIQKARLNEIEYYQYQYKPEPLRKSIDLITKYAPDILPSLDEPIPAPESRYDVRAGVGMMMWKAIAYDQLEMFDEAEALLVNIIELYGDRYRYPDPWCFSLDRHAKQYLVNIPKKRAEKAQREGGTER